MSLRNCNRFTLCVNKLHANELFLTQHLKFEITPAPDSCKQKLWMLKNMSFTIRTFLRVNARLSIATWVLKLAFLNTGVFRIICALVAWLGIFNCFCKSFRFRRKYQFWYSVCGKKFVGPHYMSFGGGVNGKNQREVETSQK